VEPFKKHAGKIAVIDENDIDTDRIIPARFLSKVSKFGYGELLFADTRGENHPLNDPNSKEATVLVVGSNFGCGSSREHAVWAIRQAGFRMVIARKTPTKPGFSDIFRQNATNNGLLLIELDPEQHKLITNAGQGAHINVDLENQTLQLDNQQLNFEIEPATKNIFLEGLDLIGTTSKLEAAISKFEETHDPIIPRQT
jgi:3-isopropylmalate/(R)-2-methylmalate dehydratase small subunit